MPGQGVRVAKRELLAHIIHQRVDEILGLVNQQIESAGYAGRLPAGVILTGGGAHLAGGVELAREVRQLPQRANLPILMATTESERSQVDFALAAGVSDFISKPFTSEPLRAKIEAVFAASKG